MPEYLVPYIQLKNVLIHASQKDIEFFRWSRPKKLVFIDISDIPPQKEIQYQGTLYLCLHKKYQLSAPVP